MKNIILSDMPLDEEWDFRKGLEKATGKTWEIKSCVSNKGRKGLYNFTRYFLYFYFPFIIFLNRKKYNKIVAWQAFYGVLLAFYCRLFHVRKQNFILIKNFTYKPKGRGLVGKLYFKWMNYTVKSGYIDIFVCTSQTFCDYCSMVFQEEPRKFVYLPFGVEDCSKQFVRSEPGPDKGYYLSLGRSNRDWQLLIDTFSGLDKQLVIICDELKASGLPANITLLKNVWGIESYKYIRNCRAMIIPIADGKIGSGETVLLQTMSLAKPIIITEPSCLADDYIRNNENGLVVEKDVQKLRQIIIRIDDDAEMRMRIGRNGRDCYDKQHSIFQYGISVGTLINNPEKAI